MAKFPPDDDSLSNVSPGSKAVAAEDGNFKRGRFNPIVILLALITVAGGGYLIYWSFLKDRAKPTDNQRAEQMQNIFLLPAGEQVGKWREWAKSDDKDMCQEGLLQLGKLRDEQAVPLATEALGRGNHSINGVAAQVIAHMGAPSTDAAKSALKKAFDGADASDRPQLMWGLVAAGETSIFKQALEMYRTGELAPVERLGGGRAFDPEKLVALVSPEELQGYAGDESASVRHLVATTLTKNADPKYLDTLLKLVDDKDITVASQAANGLGKIPDPRAREPLLRKLKEAPADDQNNLRLTFLEALRDGIGGEGLVLALDSVVKEPEQKQWFQLEQIFKMLEKLADPRAANALVKWADERSKDYHAHWRGEVGMRLAEIGDIRAVPYLAERMGQDPTKFYDGKKMHQKALSDMDDPRTFGARMLADLAVLYPDKQAELLKAEGPVIAWVSPPRPQPHANGIRFLATAKSSEAKKIIDKWAFPDEELPSERVKNLPDAWIVAPSAMRYLGRYKDEKDFDKLLKALDSKKEKKLDLTQAGMDGAGKRMLGMSLRGVGVGASEGLAEWGDQKAVKRLMEFVEDEIWHEDARLAACSAIAWCASPEDMKEVAKRTITFAKDTKASKIFIGGCYATTLSLKPVPEVQADLVDLLTTDMPVPVRSAIAQAIGSSPLEKAARDKLMEKMKDPDVKNSAAIALLLGGDTFTAAQTVAMYANEKPEVYKDMKDGYFRAFGFWSDDDFTRGNLYRWVDNAEAISRVKITDGPEMWAIQRLQAQFDNLAWDNGPHSETRVVLRQRLIKDAKGSDEKRRAGAIQTLLFMKEQGVLMSLGDEKGPVGEMAKRAYYELRNPVAVRTENVAELQAEQQAKSKGR